MRMYGIINSLPRGAQRHVAKEFSVSEGYVSKVLGGYYYSEKAILILGRLIRIIAEKQANDVYEKLRKEYVEPLQSKSSGLSKVRRKRRIH